MRRDRINGLRAEIAALQGSLPRRGESPFIFLTVHELRRCRTELATPNLDVLARWLILQAAKQLGESRRQAGYSVTEIDRYGGIEFASLPTEAITAFLAGAVSWPSR